MPKLKVGQQWEAVDIDADLRMTDYYKENHWALEIVLVTKHEGLTLGLALEVDEETRRPCVEGGSPNCFWFKENGQSFGGRLRLVRPLGSNAPALRYRRPYVPPPPPPAPPPELPEWVKRRMSDVELAAYNDWKPKGWDEKKAPEGA